LNPYTVEIPKPHAPTSGEGLGWAEKFSNWITHMSPDTMKIIVILALAAFVAYWLRRSQFLKGALVAMLVIGIIVVAFT